MSVNKEIIKKAKKRLLNKTELDVAKSMEAFDIGQFAKTAYQKSVNKDQIIKALIGAGAGGVLAGGATALMSGRKEDETEEDYRKRVIADSLINALAGSAVGAAAPTVYDAVKGVAVKDNKNVLSKVLGNTIVPGTAAGGMAVVDRTWLQPRILKDALSNLNESGGVMDAATKKLYESRRNFAQRVMSPVNWSKLDPRNPKQLGLALYDSIRRGKLRNPVIAGAASLLLPFLLKKYDQVAS